jgi:hypothetical protein
MQPDVMAETKYLKSACEHCDGHIEFPAEAAGQSVECPHCHEQTELFVRVPSADEPGIFRRHKWTALVLGTLLVIVAAAPFAARRMNSRVRHLEQERRATRAVPKSASAPLAENAVAATVLTNFSISPITMEKSDDGRRVYAAGTLKNLSDKQRFAVRVDLDLFAASGAKLRSASGYIAVIEPGAEWNFKALVVDNRAARAVLVGVREQ